MARLRLPLKQMDSLTQIALGGAVAEAALGKKIGRKSVLWGALVGTLPDLDLFIGKTMDTVEALHFHRSITHSLVFCLFASPLLAALARSIHRKHQVSLRAWSLMFFWVLITHVMLDTFTTWGTQLLWPFTDFGYSIGSIFVIDPLYTLPLLGSLVVALYFPKEHKKRRFFNYLGLVISTGYLLLTLVNKHTINTKVEAALDQQNKIYSRYTTRPAPLNNILWAANVEVQEGFYLGHLSLFQGDVPVTWQFVPKQHALLKPVINEKVSLLTRITTGFYTVEEIRGGEGSFGGERSGLLINDLRFGRYGGWNNEKSPFVFSYVIQGSGKDLTITQSPRTMGAKKSLEGIWEKMFP